MSQIKKNNLKKQQQLVDLKIYIGIKEFTYNNSK